MNGKLHVKTISSFDHAPFLSSDDQETFANGFS